MVSTPAWAVRIRHPGLTDQYYLCIQEVHLADEVGDVSANLGDLTAPFDEIDATMLYCCCLSVIL